MTVLSKEALLAGGVNLRVERVTVARLNGDVFIREITGAERDQLEQWIANENLKAQGKAVGLPNVRARVAWYVLADEEGNRLFKDVKQVEKLGDMPAQALDAIFEAGKRVNALFEADEAVAKN